MKQFWTRERKNAAQLVLLYAAAVVALWLAIAVANGAEECRFRRGDANCDGAVNISDVIYLSQWLCCGGPAPKLDAADANDDGVVDYSDTSYLSAHLTSGGPAPPPPYSSPGMDCTADGLDNCCSPTADEEEQGTAEDAVVAQVSLGNVATCAWDNLAPQKGPPLPANVGVLTSWNWAVCNHCMEAKAEGSVVAGFPGLDPDERAAFSQRELESGEILVQITGAVSHEVDITGTCVANYEGECLFGLQAVAAEATGLTVVLEKLDRTATVEVELPVTQNKLVFWREVTIGCGLTEYGPKTKTKIWGIPGGAADGLADGLMEAAVDPCERWQIVALKMEVEHRVIEDETGGTESAQTEVSFFELRVIRTCD